MNERHRIDIMLRASSDVKKMQRYKNGGKEGAANLILYNRSPSLPVELPEEFNTDLRSKIMKEKNCLIRPSSQKQKESRMFTDKCLDVLSRKKASGRSEQNRSKMRQMMDGIVDRYRANLSNSKVEKGRVKSGVAQLTSQPLGRPNLQNIYEDKVEVYRMIRSTEVTKPIPLQSNLKQTYQKWKDKPDITGVRMNNKLMRNEGHHSMEGVVCVSVPISHNPILRRNSLFVTGNQAVQKILGSNSRKKVSINRSIPQKFMSFSMSPDSDSLYMKKLKSFLDFIFKVNYSNKIYISLQLSDDCNSPKYKVFIGNGNNSLLIKSLLKRRFWLTIADSQTEQINFYWTQNKINKIHYQQKVCKLKQYPLVQSPKKKKQFRQFEDTYENNNKILLNQQSKVVEKYITKDGYYVPFSETYFPSTITNHIPCNSCIGSKKNLFRSLFCYYKQYKNIDPFEFIPKSYCVKSIDDPQYKRFLRENNENRNKVWIVKPGQNTNRGKDIELTSFVHINTLIKKQKHVNGQTKTYIIQSYIDRPFLYNGRKFDIRHFMLITSVNGILKCYWYKDGYLRTSSQKFDIEQLDNQFVHLTNDSIQQKGENYEKYESGNKLSYSEFQRYLDITYPAKNYSLEKDIIEKMKGMILDVIKANYNLLDANRRESNFQIFGFDFMIDRDFKPWLIQINSNPCLEMNCNLLNRIIPEMVENSLRIGLDAIFPPTNHYPVNKRHTLSDNYLKNLRYELLFDESSISQTLPILYPYQDSDNEEEEYPDDGKEFDQLII